MRKQKSPNEVTMPSRRFAILAALIIIVFAGLATAQEQKPVAEVPFEFVHNQVVLQVKIAGRGPFNILLDTDTNPSAIDLATARDLGLKLSGKGQQGTGGGTDVNLAYETKLPLVEVGGVTAKDVPAAAISLTKIGDRMGRPVHGVLGYSFLRGRIFQIDYRARKLRFYANSPFPAKLLSTPTRAVIPFRYDDDMLIDDVFINDQKVRATLDTGSSGMFGLTPAGIKALHLGDAAVRIEATKSVGYNGEFETRTGVLKTIRIGSITVASPEASFWGPGTGHDHAKFQVNIGNLFFKDFVMTFDFRSKIVVFEKQ
jgi:predicted aspartyl protease